MPQLDLFTFTAQAFWTLTSFFSLYVVVTKYALPQLGFLFEVRQGIYNNMLETAYLSSKKNFILKELCNLVAQNGAAETKYFINRYTKYLIDNREMGLLCYYAGVDTNLISWQVACGVFELEISAVLCN